MSRRAGATDLTGTTEARETVARVEFRHANVTAPISHACGAGLAEQLLSHSSHYCLSRRAICRSAFFVSRRCGLHQDPSTLGHPVDHRTFRRAVTHTAVRSALPTWVRLRVHVAVRRRRARYRLLRSAEPRTARPASHAAAKLGCGPSRGQLRSFSRDAPAAAQSSVVQAGWSWSRAWLR